MRTQDSLKFPSGRSVKRIKQDAKALAKNSGIPRHQALDEIAKLNGYAEGWHQAINALQNQHPIPRTRSKSKTQSRLAIELGVTDEDLEMLSWEEQEVSSNEGLIYGYVLTFDEDNPPEILQKISDLDEDLTIRVSMNAFDDPYDSFEEYQEPLSSTSDMNPYRKLLVMGLNELLKRGLLSLEWDGISNEETAHIETTIAGHNAIIVWSGIGHGEIRLSVWWKYNHEKHPQANLQGNKRESFSCNSPLAKRKHYPKFVGVVCSTWLERQTGKYLQGIGNRALIDTYMRKGELNFLKQLPNPQPFGFEPEGRFHM